MANNLRGLIRQFLTSMKLNQVRRKLESDFEARGMIRRFIVLPGQLELECFGPARTTTSTLTGRNHDGVVQEFTITSTSSEWSGRAYFPFWDDELEIRLLANGEYPSEEQTNAIKSLLAFNRCLRKDIEESVYQYLISSIVPEHLSDLEGIPLPEIKSSEEIGEYLTLPPEVSFEIHSDRPPTYSISFPTKWNYYAIEVRIKEWQISYVG